MIDANRKPTAREVRVFGLLVLVFSGALSAVVAWRPAGILGAASILTAGWAAGLVFNREFRRRPLAGLVLPAGLGVLAAATRFHVPTPAILATVLGTGTVLTLAVWAFPAFGSRLWSGWMRAAEPVGWTFSHVVLASVYYGVLTPIGLAMRLAGRDPMHRRFDRGAATYWIERRVEKDPARYFRQF